MCDPTRSLVELVRQDRRYKLEAYVFVFEALQYAQEVLGMGAESPSEPVEGAAQSDEETRLQRHVTGQELCEAIRRYALEQFGLMAKTVLNGWGVYSTSDFGEIVFNLIRIGRMRKTPEDRREDFDDLFDFDTAFRKEFRFSVE